MSIFDIYWFNVGENLTPSFWRKTKAGLESKLIPFIRSILAPVQELNDLLFDYQRAIKSYLDYTGQHIALEEYLNKTYDIVDRRIFITENNIVNGAQNVDLYLKGEVDPTPLSLYLQGEAADVPFSLYLQGESIPDTYNFTINIPLVVGFNADTVTRQVKNYSEAAKTFNIVTF